MVNGPERSGDRVSLFTIDHSPFTTPKKKAPPDGPDEASIVPCGTLLPDRGSSSCPLSSSAALGLTMGQLELAPTRWFPNERLPRLHRASPSAFLDKRWKEHACGMQAWREGKRERTSGKDGATLWSSPETWSMDHQDPLGQRSFHLEDVGAGIQTLGRDGRRCTGQVSSAQGAAIRGKQTICTAQCVAGYR